MPGPAGARPSQPTRNCRTCPRMLPLTPRDWSSFWGGQLQSLVHCERGAAAQLLGSFPSAFNPEAPLEVSPDCEENLRAAAAAAAGGTLLADSLAGGDDAGLNAAATALALEGALNRVQPLTVYQQAADKRPRPHGAHPLVVGDPMVDRAATHSAMKLIYAATTRGDARGLWPTMAKGAAGIGGIGGAPLLSAPQATEAGLVSALQSALGGDQDYTNLGAAGRHLTGIAELGEGPAQKGTGSAGTGTTVTAAAAAAAAGGGVEPGLRAARRSLERAASLRVSQGLPELPTGVRADLQVSSGPGR